MTGESESQFDMYDMLILLYLQSLFAAMSAVVHNTNVLAECLEKQTKILEQMNRSLK